MTTFIQYNPPPRQPFVFNVTLDGQAYTATVIWGLFGRRLYLNLVDVAGRLIFSRPMLGSALGSPIQSVSWQLGIATIFTAAPHGFAIADTVAATISDCVPDVLNGTRNVLITTATAFTFPLSPDPGNVSVLGKVDYNINIAAGYFARSSLVYRPQSNTFEVSP